MNYLPFDEWLPLAEALAEGSRKRVNHTCGSGNTLLISHDEEGYSAHCFRCNLGGGKKHGTRRLSDIDFKLLRGADDRASKLTLAGEVVLPEDFTLDIPSSRAMWLYRASIFSSTARRFGFGWSESMARVILPVYEDGKLVYIQARAVDKWRKPKYLNIHGASKGGTMWKGIHERQDELHHSTDSVHTDALNDGALACDTTIIITEDILSALRVHLCGYNTASTLGTSVSDAQAGYLSRFDLCVFWYDGDEAGVKGSTKGMRKLGMTTRTARIETELDPKEYPNREINRIVQTELK